MKPIMFLVLLLCVSCQEIKRSSQISPGSVSDSSDLIMGQWEMNSELCDIFNSCFDIDVVLTISDTQIKRMVYQENTQNLVPGASKTYSIVSHSNGSFRMNNTQTIVVMNYSITGTSLELCEQGGSCETYFR